MIKVLLFGLTFLFINCSKTEPTDTNENTSGVVNFWTKLSSKTPILVKINNQEKFITQVYGTQPPGCQGNEGCAFFDLPPNTYNVVTTDKNGVITSFTHTVTPGGCIQLQIN